MFQFKTKPRPAEEVKSNLRRFSVEVWSGPALFSLSRKPIAGERPRSIIRSTKSKTLVDLVKMNQMHYCL